MSNKKISQLPQGNIIPETIFPIVTSGVTSQTTFENILNAIPSTNSYWSAGTGDNSVVQNNSNSYGFGNLSIVGGQNNSAYTQNSVVFGKNNIVSGVTETVNQLTGLSIFSATTTVIQPNIPSYENNNLGAFVFSGDVITIWEKYLWDTDNIIFLSGGSEPVLTLDTGNAWDAFYDSNTDKTFIVFEEITSTTYTTVYGDIFINIPVEESFPSFGFGVNVKANGKSTFAEGFGTTASGNYSHAEGYQTQATGYVSHAEGYVTTASGSYSHAEGAGSIALGNSSHAEGNSTIAGGQSSHAGGQSSQANGNYSFVHGFNSTVNGNYSIVLGRNITGNIADTTYVDNLNIKTVSVGTSVNNLGIDSNGKVIIGSAGSSGPISVINTSSLFSTVLSGTGSGATSATYSNFIGAATGSGATSAHNSNFIGREAGYGATGANNSNFIGREAGFRATTAIASVFIGSQAGSGATTAYNSNFIGYGAGLGATNANHSNFIGYGAGQRATNATYSNFIGYAAGLEVTNARYSNLFGYQAGNGAGGNNIGNNNIIIGTNISLPNATANGINLGGVLFGSGTYANTIGNPSITGQTQGKIGINVVNPTANLHIGASTSLSALMRLEVGATPTSPNDGDIWLESNTDTGLKIRINGITKTITLS